ncbi:GNAT family N-acetyltransferase [Paenibacillus sp. LMG 31459]|uniref:GNAT family N-acetyltransferase n=1 Tax=Paenibacillus phytohabitans TaxID=2654978 RepID=A0ABX1YVU0_9BACL|nr:GNAT family N-acetyltransferase [Paenibacillus phytohabitans]NOU83888.1 GNAT family N-acetyltransferase [Paenibacillus phytohabitans]
MSYSFKKIESITEKQKRDILTLARSNAEFIGVYVVNSDSPFYPYISALEHARTRYYLEWLESTGVEKTHLIIAENVEQEIIGYLLYNCDASHTKDVSICSTVVAEQYRNKKVLTEMLELLKSESDSIVLTCFKDKVELYKKFGFKLLSHSETQIAMIFGNYSGKGEIYGVDDEVIKREVRYIKDDIKKKLGLSFNHHDEIFRSKQMNECNKAEKYFSNQRKKGRR